MRSEIVAAVLGGALIGGLFGALASSGCTRQEQPTIKRVAEGAPEVGPTPTPTPSPSGDASTADATAEVAPLTHVVLPPLDTTCAVDADCDYVAVSITGLYTCCASCGTTIGSKTWAAAVKSTCASSMVALSNPCPALACPMGPTHARCDVGRCVPKW